MTGFTKDAVVQHIRFGRGRVRLDDGDSVVVRFEHGVEECLAAELELVEGLTERVTAAKLDPALNVIARILGHCILSVNDSWGVFSRSRINLLPHQLWVCKRVLETWPTRWLVADDVGLGKTIEAGLILTPLLFSGRVRRLLILAPASLVEQWQVRLREMFDIRVSAYAPAVDTEASDYWNTHDKIVASAHTLRLDIGGRWKRLMEAKPWDLVLVDEAHHMNTDEDGRRTLSFQVVERLQSLGRIQSMVLFTGTPHRGKDHGFLSLLKLLHPSEFNPQEPLESQVHKLRNVMIRNNKHRVTDMRGNPLFTPVRQQRETYSYSPEEARFYDKLTEFITTGKAYAAGLGRQERRTAILVLITMQKLASSSVAAVHRALARRLVRLQEAKVKIEESTPQVARIEELLADDDPANMDELSRLEEEVVENLGRAVNLNPNEIPALEELLAAADDVVKETKIERILEVVEESFTGRSVLFFTEYKATQALLMSELQNRYGDGCVTFINGDGVVEGVKSAHGRTSNQKEDRRRAAERFNRSEVRFLVSTEAAGEGIDLQQSCSALIHVDLPWNPMRLHQRLGRLSRYGQTQPVDVVTVRNPDTVESRIWQCLDQKLDRITLAFQGAMDDPEDMRQLVIGMASPRMFTKVFADAGSELRGQRLDHWFDAKTATFGGEDAVETVRSLVGNAARFDFNEVANQIPKVDLPDLVPFFKATLAVLGKRPTQADEIRLSFKTPSPWMDDFTITDRYDLLFAREPRPRDGEDVAGIGLRVVDRAVRFASQLLDGFGAIGELDAPLAVFALRDRITGSDGPVRTIIVGVMQNAFGKWTLLRDWELIKLLNPLADKPRSQVLSAVMRTETGVMDILAAAQLYVESLLSQLDLPFKLPTIERLACLLPGALEQPPPKA
ncbi:DEAD/DEAH box helicase [uncultured Rhodoblastus sp.]|uniref:DEAD/DEAH box helicase n=1 Tax=uncultured Rhodoblastus sp. TaxID=543037 RepID=UPI0025F6D9CC|nr:DEAD/DEAH box helicase [uncultured Rhodoblastus sp.]